MMNIPNSGTGIKWMEHDGKTQNFDLFSWPFPHTSSGWYMELLANAPMASLIRRILSTSNEGMMISYEN